MAYSQGPGGFRELREAYRKNFHRSWYLSDAVVTSYGQKPWGRIFFTEHGIIQKWSENTERMPYAHIGIVAAFFAVKMLSFLVITSHGVGVSSSNFGTCFLLGLLYLPIHNTRAGFKSTR